MIKKASVVLCVVVLVTSCSRFSKKNIKQGVITYDITYDSVLLKQTDARLLPSELTVKFNNNCTLNTIDALSGAVSISIINNPLKQQFSTLLKVFNKKLYHTENFSDGKYPALYSRIPQVRIIESSESCKFLNYNCIKAMGYFANTPDVHFEIVYTKEIDIQNPNINTPFEMVDGVLLKFHLRINSMEMFLSARSVEHKKVPMSTFDIPDGYAAVDFKTITDLIYMLQQ